jgi:small subunit ribosomal protein S2
MTNPQLEDFLEVKVIVVTDPWPDKDAVRDAVNVGAAVVALCDTNNESNYIDLVVPCNNKGKKSLGLFFYILAREYLKNRGTIKDESEMKIPLEEFLKEE